MKSVKKAQKAAQEALSGAMKLVEDSKAGTLRLLGEQVRLWVQPLADYIRILEEEPESQRVRDLQKRLRERKEYIKQLEFDNERMSSSHRTSFRRCSKCKGLHDSVLICFCGHDDSL